MNKTKLNNRIFLTDEQQNRLYNVFDFEEYETILRAWFEDNQLVIEYINEKNEWLSLYYEPHFEDTDEDQEKLNYILYRKENK